MQFRLTPIFAEQTPEQMQNTKQTPSESPEYLAGRAAERAEILKILDIHLETQKKRMLVLRAAGVAESITLIKQR